MKTLRIAALLALVPGLALAAITGSKHDLSATTGQATLRAAAPAAGGTNQICVFCHTPHNARTPLLLWNRNTALVPTAFSGWGATNTTAGTLLPGTIGDVSRRCLSCHDGSIAVGAVVNLNGVINPPEIQMVGTHQTGGRINSTFYIVKADAMQGHHPVSIPYAAAAGGNIYNGITSLARQSATVGDYFPVQVGGTCQSPTNICTTSTTGADIQLYAGATAPGSSTNYGIECSSCHDTHNERNIPRMLRVDNESAANPSGLCMGCHNK